MNKESNLIDLALEFISFVVVLAITGLLCTYCEGCASAPNIGQPPDYDPTPTLSHYGDVDLIRLNVKITQETAPEFDTLIQETTHDGAHSVVVEIDTYGGSLSAGEDIAYDIEASSLPVVCVVTHAAASAGFLVLQACPIRILEPRAVLMIHEAFLPTMRTTLWEWMVNNMAMHEINAELAPLVCRRLNMTVNECYDRYKNGNDWWMRASEAVSVGAADGIGTTVEMLEAMKHDE